jgi:hypothetical protein
VLIIVPPMPPALRPSSPLLLAAALGMLAGCQQPDVGQQCSFDVPGVTDGPVAADYLETGKTECENLVCIRSPDPPPGSGVENNPYCSKPCVSDGDCSRSETGLVCRAVVLDPEFLASLPEDVRRKYLGDVEFSNYCAVPVE